MRSRANAALAVCLLAVLPTSGCYQGAEDTVNSQGPTGNGTDFAVGDLLVQDTTLVAGPVEGRSAALVVTVVNAGDTDDALTGVTVAGTKATIRTAPIAVKAGTSVKVGGDASAQIVVTGLEVPAGSYADVTLDFTRAGSATKQVAVVPAVGYYEGYGPAAAASSATTR